MQFSDKKKNFSKDDLLLFSDGKRDAQLPSPPMLMFDRITNVFAESEKKGFITAELDITPDLWFFDCHFKNDPVMPGCLGLDAMWQLLGFYLSWTGKIGKGRALGVDEVKFSGQVEPKSKLVFYRIDIKKIISKNDTCIGMGNGSMFCDGVEIYKANNLKVGLFKNINF